MIFYKIIILLKSDTSKFNGLLFSVPLFQILFNLQNFKKKTRLKEVNLSN